MHTSRRRLAVAVASASIAGLLSTAPLTLPVSAGTNSMTLQAFISIDPGPDGSDDNAGFVVPGRSFVDAMTGSDDGTASADVDVDVARVGGESTISGNNMTFSEGFEITTSGSVKTSGPAIAGIGYRTSAWSMVSAPASFMVVGTVKVSASADSCVTVAVTTLHSGSVSVEQCDRGAVVPVTLGGFVEVGDQESISVTVIAQGNASATVDIVATLGGRCTIFGTGEPDQIDGTDGNDVICALAGDDVIDAKGGNDVIFAGDPTDSSDDADTVEGGPGRDVIVGGRGNDTLNGGDGADTILGGRGNDTVNPGVGDDTVYGGSGNDTIIDEQRGRSPGEDLLVGCAGRDALDGGGESDDLRTVPTRTDDQIARAIGHDVIASDIDCASSRSARGNNDTAIGGDGDDTIELGPGSDAALGGEGDDTMGGGGGADTMVGGTGTDIIDGDGGRNVLVGCDGIDVLRGGSENDRLFGFDHELSNIELASILDVASVDVDCLADVDGGNTLEGGRGGDRIEGGPDDDTIDAGGGNDTVEAGGGDDDIIGGPGADTLRGEGGRDDLRARDGQRDVVDGGPAADTGVVDAKDRVRNVEAVR